MSGSFLVSSKLQGYRTADELQRDIIALEQCIATAAVPYLGTLCRQSGKTPLDISPLYHPRFGCDRFVSSPPH